MEVGRVNEERKKGSLNGSRPDGWVWMRSPGTEYGSEEGRELGGKAC